MIARLPRWPTLATAGLLAAGCFFNVGSPRPGGAFVAPEAKTLVCGRIRVVDEHDVELRPWDPAAILAPDLHLMLLRLGPREVAPGMPFHADGRFYWWLSPSDYALVGNRHDVHSAGTSDAQMQDMEVLAVLRVPPGAAVSYAGDLVIELDDVVMHDLLAMRFSFGRIIVVDRRKEAFAALEGLFGPLPPAPAVTLMCAGAQVPEFNDPGLFAAARALLDAGCAGR